LGPVRLEALGLVYFVRLHGKFQRIIRFGITIRARGIKKLEPGVGRGVGST
jgi:hypothetical protein